uniref:Rho-GAP domain-containing protein n=1 Tax=Gouania willdenowi TaxID=441366 RepID=A0A8C5D5I4_GOUWI
SMRQMSVELSSSQYINKLLGIDVMVSHLQCRERCPLPCTPNPIGCPLKVGEGCVYDVLADYAPDSSPSIPPLVISCVSEIEQRGLCEAGLYRLSGSYVQVKDLKEEFLLTNMVPVLSEVKNINTVTGLLKDFLRNLKEPLLTFRLTQAFMDAAEVSDEENSFSLLYQSISDLPKANRDTLAFLVLHLQRVAESLETRMDIHNLALVFGPTIVGHAVPNPDLKIQKSYFLQCLLSSLKGHGWNTSKTRGQLSF